MVENVSKIRELSSAELYSRLDDARQELMNFRFQQSTGELTDTSRVRKTRQYIARMMTILHEREFLADLGGKE